MIDPAVLGGGHLPRHIVTEFVDAVAVRELELPAVGHVALDVLLRHGGTHRARKDDGGGGQQAGALALEHLEGAAQQLVPEVEVQTGVVGVGRVPGEVRVRDRRRSDTRKEGTPVEPLDVVRQVETRVDGGIGAGGAVITHPSVGGAELEVRDPFEVVLDERFLADAPAHGDRREGTPAGSFGEPGRSIPADRDVKQVFAGVVIVQVADERPAGNVAETSGGTLLVLFLTREQVLVVQEHVPLGVEVVPRVVRFLIKGHGAHIVLAELVRVIQGQLQDGAHVRVRTAVHLTRALLHEGRKRTGLLRVQVVSTGVVRVVRRVVVIAVESARVQAFHIRNVVGDGQGAVEVVALVPAVTGVGAVRGHHRVLVLQELRVVVRELLAILGDDPGMGRRGVGPSLLVHRPDGRHRLVGFVGIAAQGEGGTQTVGDLRIHVGTEVPPVIVQGPAGIGTFLVHVAEVEEVGDLVGRTVHGEVVLALGNVVAEQLVGPVGAFLLAGRVVHDLFPGVLGRRPQPVVAVQVSVQVLLVDEHHVRGGGSRLRDIQEVLPAVVRGQVDVELRPVGAVGTVLGRHEDDAVRGPDAVDGGRCVLQDGHRLDFIGVHAGEVALVARNAVHHEQRRTHAADIDRVVERTRLGRALGDTQAGDLTGEHVHDVLVLGDDDVLVGHGRNGARQGSLLLDAVTHDDRLLQEVAVTPEDNAERGLRCADHRVLVADERDDQVLRRSGGDLEPSVHVGHGSACGGTLHQDAGADERLPALVLHRTGNDTVLGREGEREQRRQHGDD